MTTKHCTHSDCTEPYHASGLCITHYGRLVRYGDPRGRVLQCSSCGTEFVRPAGRSTTCSPECSAALKKTRKKSFDQTTPRTGGTRDCVVCGTSFPSRGTKLTCSPECQVKRRDDYEARRLKERSRRRETAACAWCDKAFAPKTQAKTCSPECRAQYSKAQRAARGKPLITRACVVCDAPFKTGGTSSRTITCSPECRGIRAKQLLVERQPKQNADRRGAKNRKSNLYRRFGITEEDYLRMLDAQGHACAICGTTTPGTAGVFAVDHDHTTGAVRGLLCRSCNVGIGNLGDDIARLQKAIEYLDHYRT